jgi:hypothetical protein
MDLVILVLMLPLAVGSIVALFPRSSKPLFHTSPAALAAFQASEAMRSAKTWVWQRLLPFFSLLVLLGVVSFVLVKWPAGSNLVHLLFLTRYSLLAGGLMASLVWLASRAAPSLLGNLFVLRRPLQLFNIAWLSVLAATMVVVTARVVELNAVERYSTLFLIAPDRPVSLLRFLVVVVLTLPIPLACLTRSRASILPQSPWHGKRWLVAGTLGLAAGFLLVMLVTILQFIFVNDRVEDAHLFPLRDLSRWIWEHPLGRTENRLLYPIWDKLARLLADSPGFTVNVGGQPMLAAGHAQMAILMSQVFLGYLVAYVLFVRGRVPNSGSAFASLSYFLMLLLMIGFLLQGAAFALDRYHVPLSLAVALFSFLQYQFADTDHFFELAPPSVTESSAGAPAPELLDVVRNWQFPSTLERGNGLRPQRVLVAVTASGGGIQAAAWTCRVLTGLHELYVDELARSTFLISAVSGGSVGTMYYLDSWGKGNTFALPARLRQPPGELPKPGSSLANAMESSLEATAWGLAFPDFLRVLFPPLVARTDDRGARIEAAWRQRLSSPETRLTHLSGPVLRGAMPIPVFNATMVETGQRFLASPVLGRQAACPQNWEARQLRELYPEADPYVSTMVRLSATFPFVSPICRPWPTSSPKWNEDRAYHFADGGYIDNEGMVTVVEWLYDLLDPDYFPFEERQRKFDRILILRIMPFPAGAARPAEQGRGWLYSTIGPIQALMNVRTSSQQERNDLAARLFEQALTHVRTSSEQERRNLAVRMFSKAIEHAQHDPSPEKKEELALLLFNEVASYYQVPVDVAKFTFAPTDQSQPPLSWMLNERQQMEINEAWQWLVSDATSESPLRTLDRLFRRRIEVDGSA